MNRALHLMIDHVFTRDFIAAANALGADGHDFLVYGSGIAGKKFVQPAPNVYVARYGSKTYKRIVGQLGTTYTHLFVHWLSFEAGEAVIGAPEPVKVGAFFWGNDFAEPTPHFCQRVFDPLTLGYYNETTKKKTIRWRNNPRWRYAADPVWLLKTLRNKLSGNRGVRSLMEQKQKAVARLDYFVHFNPYDLEWVNVQTPTKAKRVQFFYPAGYQEAATLPINENPQRQIVLGNSASLTNNHLDTLQRLQDAGMPADCTILVPLSYGDKTYADYLVARGREWFGAAFVPLVNYMPRDTYFKLLTETTSAVFNIKRTQALGNINAMLAMGKRVFLNPACPVYRYYVENGFIVYDVNLAYEDAALLTKPLTPEQIAINRQKLEEYFSEELGRRYLADILNLRPFD